MVLVDVVHPVQIGGNENVRGRCGVDLLRQCVAGAIRDNHLVAGAGFELFGLFVQRLFEAGGSEDRYVGRRDRRSRARQIHRERDRQ
jgi:hypothetical protein